ncbi:hypothetical protein CMK11_18880 [Candidatus Poribacteria bacterium]|nr:hypothetical protein [Candidatus Poribacteria bacterium]
MLTVRDQGGPFVIGVDGGATKTVGVLAGLDGPEARRAVVGPTNLHAADGRAVARNLRKLAGELSAFGASGRDVAATVLGMAGAGRPAEARRLRELAASAGFSCPLVVATDARVALHGATGGSPGILVIAGTGSMCYGRDGDGSEARAGGWGHVLDDAGSGYAIGLAALRAVVRQADGRADRTPLADTVLPALGVDIEGLVPWAATASKADIAALAPAALAASANGDAAAVSIVASAARDLAALVAAVGAKLGLASQPVVVLSGSLLECNESFRRQVASAVLEWRPDARIELPSADGAWGAVLMARELVEQERVHVS